MRTTSWTRTDLRIFQFVYWSRLLEIDEHLRIFRDVFTIKSERIPGYLFHCCMPVFIRAIAGGAGQCFERGCDHDLEVPFCQHWIGILPVEYLSLFRDTNLARIITRRLRKNGGSGRAPTASSGSAAAMKQAQPHPVFGSCHMQRVVGFIEFPNTR